MRVPVPAMGHVKSVLVLALVAALSGSASAEPSIQSQEVEALVEGVELITGRTANPGNDFYALRVDLCATGIRVDATAPPSTTRSAQNWGNSVDALASVNGDFFLSGPKVHGLAVGGGEVWPASQVGSDPSKVYYQKFGWIAVGPDWAQFNHTRQVKEDAASMGLSIAGFEPSGPSMAVPDGTLALVSGYSEVVTEGVPYQCAANPPNAYCFFDRADLRFRHPRTAMGLSQDRRTLYLLVVDGRSTSSAGMYGTELGWLIHELGAWQAFNLDGGGSSQIWVQGRGTINNPSDGSPPAVANHWGIFFEEGAQPGHCTPAASEPDAGPPSGSDGSVGPNGGDAGNVNPPGSLGGGCAVADGAVSANAAMMLLCAFVLSLRARRRAQ